MEKILEEICYCTVQGAYDRALAATNNLQEGTHKPDDYRLVWAYDTLLDRLMDPPEATKSIMETLAGKLEAFGVKASPPEPKKKPSTGAVGKRSRRYVPSSLAMTHGPISRSVLSSAMSASAMSASVPEDGTFLVLGGNTSLDI